MSATLSSIMSLYRCLMCGSIWRAPVGLTQCEYCQSNEITEIEEDDDHE